MSLTSRKTPALRLREVHKSFGQTVAVSGVTLEVAAGEILSLVGPSGCGKSTTLRLIAGLTEPDSGSIEIGGRDVEGVPPERRRLGFVFQDLALFPHLTVADNLAFGIRKLTRWERKARVGGLLRLIEMEGLANRFPRELSGGQQQRVALGRALAPSPALLLLDEPLSNLDPQLRRQVRHEVTSIIRASGAAALWVTHDHDEGLIVADRVAIMRQGSLRQVGPPAEVWRQPADGWVAGFIGSGDLLTGVARDGFVGTPLGKVRAPEVPDGARAQVLVRPEDVIMNSSGAPGVVVRRHFSGNDNVYCVELEGGSLLHCRQPEGVEIARGTKVRVELASDQLPVYT